MGATMHLHVEKRVGDSWVYVPSPVPPKPRGPRGEPHPSDWYADQQCQCYDEMAFLVGVRNSDGFKPVAEWRGKPDGASEELESALDWMLEGEGGPTWIMLDEIKSYDLDQVVEKPARLIQPDELIRLGWLGNGDGTAYLDIRRRGYRGEIDEGYALQPFPVRHFVSRFVDEFIPTIEAACNARPEDIRLTVWFD